jgi:ureidoglycolate hydrolase
MTQRPFGPYDVQVDTATATLHWLSVRELTSEAFAACGEIVRPVRTGGQAAPAGSQEDARLVLSDGVPRLWIMQLPHVGLSFSRIARHRRVTQCLGSMEGKEWLISVAPPGDSDDGARPRIEDIVAFRVPSNVIIKLHVGTWHAGPHVTGPGGLFLNLEHADTNTNDHQSVDLGVECRYRVPQ